ncbi:MAG: hypothetical protein ACOCYE_12185, partial [Pseudomonadota bacterium]
MSYLSLPRLTFSGRFRCDVSTVNNDVRHFDNATFESRFQKMQTAGGPEDGWWNPSGTAAFQFVDVAVQRAQLTAADQGANPDPAVGVGLVSQLARSAAKMVDLDPQWQNASMIFGLRVALTVGDQVYMTGLFEAAPFRDLYFMRVQGLGGDGGASAKFTSILTDVTWFEPAGASPVLTALRDAAKTNGHRLSINLMTYGFQGNAKQDTFTFGQVAGTIGPWRRGEARSFAAGRRFAPRGTGKYLSDPGSPSKFATPDGIGFFDAIVEPTGNAGEASTTVSVDLGNALPLADMAGKLHDLGTIELAVLRKADAVDGGQVTPGIAEGDPVTPADVAELGAVPYLEDDWLTQTAGVVDVEVTGPTAALLRDHPLALIGTAKDGKREVLIRETNGGFFVRADEFQHRMDSVGGGRAVKAQATLYARRYGRALAGHPLGFALSPPLPGQGGGNPNAPDPPKAPIPCIGTPTDRLRFWPRLETAADGTVVVPLYALDPGCPRGYLDGQIYLLEYTLDGPGG